MSRGDIHVGRLRTEEDLRRAIRKIAKRLNEIEASSIHQGDGVAALAGGALRQRIVSGRIRVSRNWHRLSAETGSADDLTNLDGGEDGQLLALEAFGAQVITVKHTTGGGPTKIKLEAAADVTLDNSSEDKLVLLKTEAAWYEVGRMSTSGSGVIRTTTAVSGSLTLDASHDVVLVDATLAAVTVTLPPAADTKKQLDIKKIDSSANAVTIDGDGAETIDGATTIPLGVQYESVTLVSDGSGWNLL